MNLNRRAAIPAGAVVLFIILLLFAFMFGALFYVRAGDTRDITVGAEKSTKPCINSVRKEIDALQQDITVLQRKSDVQTSVVQRLDADLLRYGSTHYLIAGDGSEDALVEAHMLGVRIFSEVTLLEFLQPHDLSGIRKSDNRKSGLPK